MSAVAEPGSLLEKDEVLENAEKSSHPDISEQEFQIVHNLDGAVDTPFENHLIIEQD